MRDCIKTKDIWLPNPNELDNTTKTFDANKNSPKQKQWCAGDKASKQHTESPY